MRAPAGLAAGLLLCGGGAWACGEGLGAGARAVNGEQGLLVYKTEPEQIEVGRHFALDIALCPHDDPPAPTTLRVDAHMPAHKHGMNYRPSISRRGPGLYRAEGLMFHMPGRWELVFEVRSASGSVQRLTQALTID